MAKSKGSGPPAPAKKAAIAASGKKKQASGLAGSLVPTLGAVAVVFIAAAAMYWFGGDQLQPAAVSAPAKAAVEPDGPCTDTHDMCEAWHKAGRCPTRGHVCRATCGRCKGVQPRNPRVSHEKRCQRDNHTAAVPEGQLGRLFEHTLSFSQYNPTVLSRDPWIVRFDNFISDDEANAFIDVCQPKFERSLAGDQLNPVRTSYQCWCNFADCFASEHVHRVTRRMNEVTGTPYNNGEDLQVVRYMPGEFYKQHHDQNTAIWAPQGPRVLTFFMYLNDPVDGGETRFPLIGGGGGLVVKPKKGSAILWPSTFNGQPMEADDRTLHEAMPVHSGIKYGANMWVHQFSFKTPSERGCELTYVNTMGRHPAPEHRRLVDGIVPTTEETIAMACRGDGAAAGSA